MKKYLNFSVIVVLLMTLCFGFTSCDDDDDNGGGSSGKGSITMVTKSMSIELDLEGTEVVVDWGDGTIDKFGTYLGNYFETKDITHEYSQSGNKTIKISGDIGKLDCNYCQVISLDLSKCNLTYLICNDNEITHLDLSKQTNLYQLSCFQNQITDITLGKHELVSIDCSNNNLSALVLNAMFNTLKTVNPNISPSPNISFNENPGTKTCDTSILDAKGWYYYIRN